VTLTDALALLHAGLACPWCGKTNAPAVLASVADIGEDVCRERVKVLPELVYRHREVACDSVPVEANDELAGLFDGDATCERGFGINELGQIVEGLTSKGNE
jgi:hypothetical protein